MDGVIIHFVCNKSNISRLYAHSLSNPSSIIQCSPLLSKISSPQTDVISDVSSFTIFAARHPEVIVNRTTWFSHTERVHLGQQSMPPADDFQGSHRDILGSARQAANEPLVTFGLRRGNQNRTTTGTKELFCQPALWNSQKVVPSRFCGLNRMVGGHRLPLLPQNRVEQVVVKEDSLAGTGPLHVEDEVCGGVVVCPYLQIPDSLNDFRQTFFLTLD